MGTLIGVVRAGEDGTAYCECGVVSKQDDGRGFLWRVAARGVRIPWTVCVEVPSAARGARREGLQGSGHQALAKVAVEMIDAAVSRTGAARTGVDLVVRGMRCRGVWWPPVVLATAVQGGGRGEPAAEDRRSRQLARRMAEVSAAVSDSGRSWNRRWQLVVQALFCETVHGERTSGVVWTQRRAGGLYVDGYVKAEAGNGARYLRYADWAARLGDRGEEIERWLEAVGEGRKRRITFGVGQSGPCLLDIHRWEDSGDPTGASVRAVLPENSERGRDRRMRGASALGLAGLEPLACVSWIGSAVATGVLALTWEVATQFAQEGRPVVWCGEALRPREAGLLRDVVGVVCRVGGPASHMTLVARGCGVAVLAGIESLRIDTCDGMVSAGSLVVREGEWVTIDEGTGTLFRGRPSGATERPALTAARQAAARAEQLTDARILVNADTPRQIRAGLMVGAAGVGLCRSENHLRSSEAIAALERWLVAGGAVGAAVMPPEVSRALEVGLEEAIRAVEGRPLHYRLLDIHLDDVLPAAGCAEAKQLAETLSIPVQEMEVRLGRLRAENNVRGARGCRWGIRTGVYRWQLRMIHDTVARLTRDGAEVALTVLVPSVVSARELQVIQRIAAEESPSRAAPERGPSPTEFQLGCMVETPRACIIAADLARYAHVLCFGTNDLTDAVWALAREGSSKSMALLRAEGAIETDPFAVLDRPGVGRLVAATIRRARGASAKVRIGVCGEVASDPESASWLLRAGADWVSCRPEVTGAVRAAAERSKQRRHRNGRRECPIVRSRAARAWKQSYGCMQSAIACGAVDLAQQLAREWAEVVRGRLDLAVGANWKFFKRDVVEHWFGRAERRRFGAGWSVDDVLAYASEFRVKGRRVRYSVFPDSIACHAVSRVLPAAGNEQEWRRELKGLESGVAIEVFPQQPETQLCFRAAFWGAELHVEAGIGQAMYVFENERGKHAVAKGVLERSGAWRQSGEALTAVEQRVSVGLDELVKRYGAWLFVALWDMSTTLGVPWLGVEGYYDTQHGSKPVVCDADLPHDIAFMH